MADNNKKHKIDKEFTLTDSSVNEYGFRLLTSGYQIDEFKRNPIGYYMHVREDGVICLWEDLRVDGDKVFGKPVINLANPKGEQAMNEVENGFLNCASIGQIVVLEYHVEPHPERPEESILTVTKWYNKEISLVDIPGNRGVLPQLFDINDQELKLADLTSQFQNPTIMKQLTIAPTPALMAMLPALADNANVDAAAFLAAVQDLASRYQTACTDRDTYKRDKEKAEKDLNDLQSATYEADLNGKLEKAMTDKKINAATKANLHSQYTGKVQDLKGLQTLLDGFQATGSIIPNLKDGSEFEGKTWDDLHKANKLPQLKSGDPELYKKLFKEKYGREPKM